MPPTAAEIVFIEDVLFQCMYAVGCGAQMPVDRDALKKLLTKVRPAFTAMLTGPSPIGDPPGLPRWNKVRAYILNCWQAIGRLAAYNASADGKYSIEQKHLMAAYKKVRSGNAGGPGGFCPF
jgi:hypothetical protein